MINYLVLVNKNNKLPDNWESIIELATTTDFWNNPCKVEKKTLEMFNLLKNDLLNNNIVIGLDSCYRSSIEQQRIWDEFLEKYGIDYVNKYVAVPGYSEHHTALAIDIILVKDGKEISSNEEMIKEEEIFNIIHNKLSSYGFILRYPKKKESITGYGYEPWHIRYIDNINIAKYIMDNNLTLEEYIEK